MHGYFLSLKLYSTARLMANPNSYDEHREKLINARMEAKAESRIRAKKDQPKVNKALAERLRRVEESGGKKSSSSKSKATADGTGADPTEAGVLSDPRFKELFENPEYEVDEQSREFALLNPATVHNANLNANRKTAVQDEEDDSAGSSSGLGESDDENEDDEEDEGDDKDDAGSEDDASEDDEGASASGSGSDSDDGDLGQHDPRKLKPGQEKRQMLRHYEYNNRPQLQVGSSSNNSGASSSSTSFGQRLHSSKNAGKESTKSDPRLDNVLAMRKSGDGGMEMSFIPSGSSKPNIPGKGGSGGGLFNDDYDEEVQAAALAAKRREKKVERFGHGLQKGLEEDDGEDLEGDSRSGRTKRRHPGRSASKNAFRKR